MPEYKVIESSFKREFDGSYGKTHVYRLSLAQGNETFTNVEILQKPDTPAPKEGDVLAGTLKETEYGLKFQKDQQQRGGGARPEDPKRSAAILRQHSQHMALLYVQNQPLEKRPQAWGEFWVIVDKFDADVVQARERA